MKHITRVTLDGAGTIEANFLGHTDTEEKVNIDLYYHHDSESGVAMVKGETVEEATISDRAWKQLNTWSTKFWGCSYGLYGIVCNAGIVDDIVDVGNTHRAFTHLLGVYGLDRIKWAVDQLDLDTVAGIAECIGIPAHEQSCLNIMDGLEALVGDL